MSAYDFDTNVLANWLIPPQLRQAAQLAWHRVMLKPLQWLRDWFFDSYIAGSNALPFDVGSTPYNRGQRALENYAVYECIVNGTTLSPSASPTSWQKIQDIFIGADERIKYNSQIIVLEYALNKRFQPPLVLGSQIFINNNPINTSVFVMGNTSATSSNMSNSGANSTAFMWNVPVYNSGLGSFTVNVPAALYTTLGNSPTNRERAIRQFVDKYKLAGTTYSVATF